MSTRPKKGVKNPSFTLVEQAERGRRPKGAANFLLDQLASFSSFVDSFTV